jgi:hypothetical protein
MRFKLKAVGAEFFDSAPQRQVGVFEIARPASEVWAELVADDTLHWCGGLSSVVWKSPRPFGVGTTRTAKTSPPALTLDEVFFRWEEGTRKSFYVAEASLPLFTRFAEDYLVEEVSATASRFTWTVASEAPLLARPGNPLNALITKRLFRDTRKHFSAA